MLFHFTEQNHAPLAGPLPPVQIRTPKRKRCWGIIIITVIIINHKVITQILTVIMIVMVTMITVILTVKAIITIYY